MFLTDRLACLEAHGLPEREDARRDLEWFQKAAPFAIETGLENPSG